jgi:hypothetical protein
VNSRPRLHFRLSEIRMLLFSCLREERENSPDCFLRGASGAQVELAEAGAELQTEQSRRFFGKREVRFFVPVSHRKSGGADDRESNCRTRCSHLCHLSTIDGLTINMIKIFVVGLSCIRQSERTASERSAQGNGHQYTLHKGVK